MHTAVWIPRPIGLIDISPVLVLPRSLFLETRRGYLLSDERGQHAAQRLDELAALHEVDRAFADSLVADGRSFWRGWFFLLLELDIVQPYFAALVVKDAQSNGHSSGRGHTKKQRYRLPLIGGG